MEVPRQLPDAWTRAFRLSRPYRQQTVTFTQSDSFSRIHPTSPFRQLPARTPPNVASNSMAKSEGITGITNSLSKATLGDGATAKDLSLPNTLRPRALVTSLTTAFEVVWYKPHRTIWLQYADRDKAELIQRALDGKHIGGVRVRCKLKENRQNTFSVQMQGVPDQVQLPEIMTLLPPDARPVSENFSPLSYPASLDALTPIREKIRARTGEKIKECKPIGVENGSKMKAEITLDAEALNLSEHAKALDGVILPDLGDTKVFFAERLHLYLAIDSSLYERRSKNLKGISNRAWSEHHILVKIFDGDLRYRQSTYLISIKGNGRAAVMKVKAEIDKCIFADTTHGLQLQAGQVPSRYIIQLNLTKQYKQATEGGIERLQKYCGEDAVVFDDNPDLPCITIETTANKFDKAKSLLFQEKPAKGDDIGECSICAEDDVVLLKTPGCGHTCCVDCLNTYCTTDVAAQLPLHCFSAADCSTFLPIHWLEEHLSPAAYKSLFADVIAAQCKENPDRFVQCAGLDCSTHLAVSPKSSSKVICPTCLTVNCTSCKVQYHFNETCEASKARRDPQDDALRRYLATSGGKLCPQCATPSVKWIGCAHVECVVCRVHYCWDCLEIYPNMGAVYEHMDAVHGGIDGQGPMPGRDEGQEVEDGDEGGLPAAILRELPRIGNWQAHEVRVAAQRAIAAFLVEPGGGVVEPERRARLYERVDEVVWRVMEAQRQRRAAQGGNENGNVPPAQMLANLQAEQVAVRAAIAALEVGDNAVLAQRRAQLEDRLAATEDLRRDLEQQIHRLW